MSEDFDSLELIKTYIESKRFEGIKRDYSPEKVQALRSKLKISYDLSNLGALNLWKLLNEPSEWISGLGSATVQQAMQLEKLNYQILYVSGWQIAAESNFGTNTYPDLSLYPSNSTPEFVRKINNTLLRKSAENKKTSLPPIIADGESGFGGIYSVFDITSQFINAGTAGVHFEDQLASEKKCGHVGGKVVIPTFEFIKKLNASRLASDVTGVPIVIIARTDSLHAKLTTSDFDERDKEYLSKNRTSDGYYEIKDNKSLAITKSLAYAKYSDVIWCETNDPDLGFAKEFAQEIKSKFPNKFLAYNCSPSLNWMDKFSKKELNNFQESLFDFGYNLQFVSLAGFHSMISSFYELGANFKEINMEAIANLQLKETQMSKIGYTGLKHQQEVGSNYYELVGEALLGDESELLSKNDSTENNQF